MQELQFISDGSIEAIKTLLKCAGEKKLAVAYWGSGATKEFGVKELPDAENIFILCDLFSGSCNPKEIKALLDRGCKIKTIDGLHAKVYCSTNTAIIGSNNASANGFAFNKSAFSKNVEANVLVSEPTFVLKVNAWFDQYWNSALAKSVTPLMLKDAEPLWTRNSYGKGRQNSETLIELIDQKRLLPDRINAKVIFYSGGQPSKKALETYEDYGVGQYDEAQRRAFGDYTPFYEDSTGWPVNPGAVYLDFSTQATKPVFGGVWRVRDNFSIQIGNGPSRIILLDQELDLAGVRIAASDTKLFCDAIAKFMKRNPKLWAATKANHYNIFEFDFAEFWLKVFLPAR
jgi:phospholipase D-like protein